VPQLPYAESSRSCKDFISANLQASVQKEVMLQQGEGVKQGPAFKRVRTCYISFGVERKRVGAACANVLFEGLAASQLPASCGGLIYTPITKIYC
jgi:hypothetical protein